MPGWYQKLKNLQETGKLQIVGLIQEQHPDRCRLFMAWKKQRFPILVDTLNRVGVHAIPMMWALDEGGIVVETRPKMTWLLKVFLGQGSKNTKPTQLPPPLPDPPGVRAFLAGKWKKAIALFTQSCRKNQEDGRSFFRLGCAFRARFDRKQRKKGDFQKAIDAWTRAVALSPQNYIFRRRLQQYGPRLNKPYPFYSWVEKARRELRKRGEIPPPLLTEPKGSELASPMPKGISVRNSPAREPDPKGKVPRDLKDSIGFEAVLAPRPAQPGSNLAVHLIFRPNPAFGTTWDNDGGPLQAWLQTGKGFRLAKRLLTHPLPSRPSSREERSLDFELGLPPGTGKTLHLKGYALYFVCEKTSGRCIYFRRDFDLPIPIGRKAR